MNATATARQPATGSCFTCVTSNPLAFLRVFCLPFAGGSATVFREWHRKLTPAVEVVPVEIPGRGTRFKEPPIPDLVELVSLLADQIEGHVDSLPYVFFGYSMGGHIAYELTRELRRRGRSLPVHLFVAAAIAPQGRKPEPPLHSMSDEELIAELEAFDGTPPGVLDNPKIMETLMPGIRADFALSETYSYVKEALLEMPLTVYGGERDHAVRLSDLELWKGETHGSFQLEMLPGGHFFLFDCEKELLRKLSATFHGVAKRVALIGE